MSLTQVGLINNIQRSGQIMKLEWKFVDETDMNERMKLEDIYESDLNNKR